MEKTNQQSVDPVKKQGTVSKEDMGGEMSPMDAPSEYDPPAKGKYEYAQLNPFFQNLMDEHRTLQERMARFKSLLEILKMNGEMPAEIQSEISDFFIFFDQEFVDHNRKEEKYLFPVLREKLIEAGEHSPSKNPITGVDVLEDEHLQAIQLSTICQNNLNILSRIPDKRSRLYLLHQAIDKGNDLIELIDLHIFREDEIIFGLAQELLSDVNLNELAKKI